jgi:23S rRNA pseudouridine1911/1915/1917 synthase
MPRQGLHAKSLGFIHPMTKKKMMFDSELPADFTAVLEKWRHYMHYNPFEEEEGTRKPDKEEQKLLNLKK